MQRIYLFAACLLAPLIFLCGCSTSGRKEYGYVEFFPAHDLDPKIRDTPIRIFIAQGNQTKEVKLRGIFGRGAILESKPRIRLPAGQTRVAVRGPLIRPEDVYNELQVYVAPNRVTEIGVAMSVETRVVNKTTHTDSSENRGSVTIYRRTTLKGRQPEVYIRTIISFKGERDAHIDSTKAPATMKTTSNSGCEHCTCTLYYPSPPVLGCQCGHSLASHVRTTMR